MTVSAYGIDISSYQTLSDARAAYDNGIRFAYLKATEDVDWSDPKLHDFAAALTAVGIRVGVYHFARPGDPVAQAHYFKSVAGQYMQPGNLRPALDIEANASTQDSWHNAFHDALGIPSMVYGSLSWFQNRSINPAGWGSRDVLSWVADYNGDPGAGFTPPLRAAVHQHSSSGIVPGISGSIDRDVIFNGYTLSSITLGSPTEVSDVNLTDTISYTSREDGTTRSRTVAQCLAMAADLFEMYSPGYSNVGPEGRMANELGSIYKAARAASNLTVSVDPVALKTAISEALAGAQAAPADVIAEAVLAKLTAATINLSGKVA